MCQPEAKLEAWYNPLMAKKRKTKKEKIIASLKRQVRNQQTAPVPSPAAPPLKIKTVRKAPIKGKKPPEEANVFVSTAQIKKDLAKTLILSLVAIGIELVLYWKVL